MASFRHHRSSAGANLADDERWAEWEWGAVRGRWSVAQALTVMAGLSLIIWVSVLIALL